jgi:protein-tyrosine phosphatase
MRENFPTPFPRSYWVIPGKLLAGAYPGDRDRITAEAKMKQLFDAGIRSTVNLMESDEVNSDGAPFVDYALTFREIVERHGEVASCLRFPIRDLGIPGTDTMQRILDALDQSIEADQPVYVHCWGGIGRTGTVVGCFLIRRGLAENDNVLEKIRELRFHDEAGHRPSPETTEQCRYVQRWRK